MENTKIEPPGSWPRNSRLLDSPEPEEEEAGMHSSMSGNGSSSIIYEGEEELATRHDEKSQSVLYENSKKPGRIRGFGNLPAEIIEQYVLCFDRTFSYGICLKGCSSR